MSGSSIEQLAGAFLVLVCLAYILFGILIAQVYYYWFLYKDDQIKLKVYVWIVCLLAVCHSAFNLALLYDYFVAHFGDAADGVEHITWSARGSLTAMAIMIAMTQSLYVSRIWHLSGKSIIITAIPTVFVLARFAFGAATIAYLCSYESWVAFSQDRNPGLAMNGTFIISVLADGTTSSLLLYYLAVGRSGIPSRTIDMINKLMIYVVNTGAITMIFGLAVVFMYNFAKDSLLFAGFYMMLGKMYANTMLAMLNARRTTLNPDTVASAIEFHSIEFSNRPPETPIRIYTDARAMNISDHDRAHVLHPELSRTDLKPDEYKAGPYALA